MGVDLRQVVAAVLTLTMFVMLGNMIKRDHFDSLQEKLPGGSEDSNFETVKFDATHVRKNIGLWKGDVDDLKPCWVKPSADDVEQTEGFVTFALTNGPEYHISQIADAVIVARSLGATLVIPDIRGSQPGDRRNFEDIYDVDVFTKSLEGVVRVVKDLPGRVSTRNIAAVKVPNRVTEDYIAEHVEPIYRTKGSVRLATYFPSINMRKAGKKGDTDSVACLAMFGSLELQPEMHEVVDSIVERLRTLSRNSDGQFIAVDLRVEMLDKKGCQNSDNDGEKSCYNAQEIAVFLRQIGFDKDTTVYVTESRWDSSLDSLKDLFPKTYTKEAIMPADKKKKFLDSEFEKVIDFYISAESDVFVPAISGLFYANVVGKRIGSGKTRILVPASSASASNFLSPYVSKSLRKLKKSKSHAQIGSLPLHNSHLTILLLHLECVRTTHTGSSFVCFSLQFSLSLCLQQKPLCLFLLLLATTCAFICYAPKLLADYGFLRSPKGLSYSIQVTVKCVQSVFCSSQFVCKILVASFLFIIVVVVKLKDNVFV